MRIDLMNLAMHEAGQRNGYRKGYKDGYAKAITEFAERIKYEIENCSWQFSRLEPGTIDDMAKELKGE